jgi:hypothetical protein
VDVAVAAYRGEQDLSRCHVEFLQNPGASRYIGVISRAFYFDGSLTACLHLSKERSFPMRTFLRAFEFSLIGSFALAGLIFAGYHIVLFHADSYRLDTAWTACAGSAEGSRVWSSPSFGSLGFAGR